MSTTVFAIVCHPDKRRVLENLFQGADYDLSIYECWKQLSPGEVSRNQPVAVLIDAGVGAHLQDCVEIGKKIRKTFGLPVIFLLEKELLPRFRRLSRSTPSAYLTYPLQWTALKKLITAFSSGEMLSMQAGKNPEWLSGILKSLGEAIITTDLKGNIRFFNSQSAALFRRKASALRKGKKIWDVFELLDDRGCSVVKPVFSQVLMNGKIHRQQVFCTSLHPENLFELEVLVSPLKDLEERILGTVWTLRDVSEKKQIERSLFESEIKYRAVIEQSPDNIFFADADTHRILDANPALQRLLGYTREELLQMTPYDFIDHDRRDIDDKVKEILRAGRLSMGIRRYRTRQGGIVYVDVYASVVDFGNKKAICVVSRDVTERLREEEEKRLREERIETFNRVLLDLTLKKVFIEADFYAALKAVTEMAGKAMNLERTSIWRYEKHSEELICLDLYQKSRDNHSQGMVLRALDYPRYFRALERDRLIDASDALTDPRTREYRENYLLPLEIKSMLDAPIRLGQQLKGVICFEHLRTFREWTLEEKNFASSIADLLSLMFEFHERKKVEEALRSSEERYRSLFEGVPIGLFRSTPEGKILAANRALLSMLGFEDVEELSRIRAAELYQNPEIRRRWMEKVDRQGTAQSIEHQLIRKDGQSIWVRENIRAVRDAAGNILFYEGSIEEITQHKETEEALKSSEERYRDLVENSRDIIGTHDLKGYMLSVNKATLEILGYKDKSELLGRHLTELVEPQFRRLFPRYLKEIEEKGVVRGIMRILTRDGRVRILEYHNSLKQSGAEPPLVRVLARDITEHYKAEQALAAEKERLAVTLKSIGEGVIATDKCGCIILMNRVAEKLTGWRLEEVYGRPVDEVLRLESNGKKPVHPVERVLKSRKSLVSAYSRVLQHRRGRRLLVNLNAALMHNSRGEVFGVVVVFQDITEQKRMEEELHKAQKLESLGILAGGIAHDFNNILTGILGNISLARMGSGGNHALAARLEEAEKACLRAKDLTQQLLTFAKGGVPIKETASLQNILTETVEFVLRGSRVQYRSHMASDLWPAEVDKGQISQVIQNLVINSVQAMPDGGTLSIRAENEAIHQTAEIQGVRIPPGNYIRIEIEDEGIGIPQKYLDKIFDPYFTTKQDGSGLGLAICYSIIRKHGGYILVASEVGKGTVFTIYLPAKPEEVKKKQAEDMFPNYLPEGGGGRVLVMDDEPTICDVARQMLEYMGYEVETAADGQEAIRLYRTAMKRGCPFDLVIMDLTIPAGMGGKEAIQELKKIDPHVLAIVSSGYSNDPVFGNYQQYGFQGCVTKPFGLKELKEALVRTFASRKNRAESC